MSLLDQEGDPFDPEPEVELGELFRSGTGSPLVDDFQLHRPRDKKEKKSKATEESRKGALSLRRAKAKDKDKEKDIDKTPKRSKQARSKSGSRTPPDSPKLARGDTQKRLAPSPSVAKKNKRYSQLGWEDASSDEEEDGYFFLSNQTTDDSQPPPPPSPPPSPSSPTTLSINPIASPTRRATVQFPVQFPGMPPATEPTLMNPAQAPPQNPQLIATGGSATAVPLFFLSPASHPPLLPTQSPSHPPHATSTTSSSSSPLTDADLEISEELRSKCMRQFAELTGGGTTLQGGPARNFFIQSHLPNQELSAIWRLADVDRDNALSQVEFCIAMKLVLLRRKGFDIPSSLPDALKPTQDMFRDNFVTEMSAQTLPPPPSSSRRVVKSTQSAMELPSPAPQDKKKKPPPRPPAPPLVQVVQKSAPDLLGATDQPEESRTEDQILVEIGDTGSSDTGPLVGAVTPPSRRANEPTVGRIITLEGEEEEEELEEGEGAAILQPRNRTTSEGSITEKQPQLLSVDKPVRRAKSLRDPSPRTVTGRKDSHKSPSPPAEDTRPMIALEEPSPENIRKSKPRQLSTEKGKYSSLGSSDQPSPAGTPVEGEGELQKEGELSVMKQHGHARSTSLDLKKMLQDDHVHEGLPSAVPPKPPPKRKMRPHTPLEEEKVTSSGPLRRSASTGSISSVGQGSAVPPVDKQSPSRFSPDDSAVDTATAALLLANPTPRPRPNKKAPLLPPTQRPRRPPPPIKPKQEPEVSSYVAADSKLDTSLPTTRSKLELQGTIRSLKETNSTLTTINKSLEDTFFKLMEERVTLNRELELLQSQQH